jgi:hypothetical protein
MSTYRAVHMSDRVMIIHDTEKTVFLSELEMDQAEILCAQLQIAIRKNRMAEAPQIIFRES